MLLHQKHACTGAPGLKQLAGMSRHSLPVESDRNSTLRGGEGQHLRVGNPRQSCVVGGGKIDCGFAAQATTNDRIAEAGIRQEANHPSTSSPAFAAAYAGTSDRKSTRLNSSHANIS